MRWRLVAQLVAIVLAVASGLSGANAGGGYGALHSRVRLIAAGPVEGEMLAGRTLLPAPHLLAGVEIRLDPGWKTYWRTPGDGIAPHFDWTGSRNVAAEEVLWPAPHHFRDAIGAYNGYKHRVVFPVVVAPQSPGKPVTLDLKLDYAVCKDICIPVAETLSVRLGDNGTGERDAVLDALRRVPARADAQGRCGGVAFDRISRERDASQRYMRVAIAHAPGAAPEDLFAEISTGQFVPHPQRQPGAAADRTVFRVDLGAGGDPAALKGETVTLTAVATPRSCETAWTVE